MFWLNRRYLHVGLAEHQALERGDTLGLQAHLHVNSVKAFNDWIQPLPCLYSFEAVDGSIRHKS